MDLKIFYVANNRLPTKKAHGIQITKMCEAFNRNGVECELIIPRISIDPTIKEKDIPKFYNIDTSFKITHLWSLDLIHINLGSPLNKFLFWVQQLSFVFSLKKYLPKKKSIVYSRDQFTISVLDSEKYTLYWEAHNFPKNIDSSFYQKVLDKIKGLIVISEGLKHDFEKYYQGRIIVAHDAVDVDEFNIKETKEEARKELDLSLDKKIIMYTGHFYTWKGVDVLLDVAKNFKNDYLFVFVGGVKKNIREFKEKADGLSNVMFLGHKPHRDIPMYLKAADCLILTGKKSESISEKYTSPLKLFEYMASGTPIVAQKLPSFLEVLNYHNSFLVNADDPESLTDGINKVLSEPDLSTKIATNALNDVKDKTWLKRAEEIYTFIKK